jgi:PadR family transcriptional regulator, regulatory protein AphA
MSLPHAILGFLRDQSQTGYDLKTQCFDQSVAHFWPADQAQIYRTLDKLMEQGFIEGRLEIQEERPNRKVYYLTEDGRGELERWLRTEQALPVYREPFLVQLFFAQEMSNVEVLAQIQKQLDAHRALLDTYNRIEIPDSENLPQIRKLLELRRMTLDYGKRAERASIEWLIQCMEKMKELGD